MKWISVKDQLPIPNEKKDILGINIDSSPEMFWIAIYKNCDYYNKLDFYEEEGRPIHITHWMPLPEPPRE